MKSVSTRLSQSDLVSLFLVSLWLHRTLISYPSFWLAIDLREMNNVGHRLIAALSLPRYQHVKQINLEMAKGGCFVIFVKKPMSKPRTNGSTVNAHLVELLVICCVQNKKSPNVSLSQTVTMVKSWPSEHTLIGLLIKDCRETLQLARFDCFGGDLFQVLLRPTLAAPAPILIALEAYA